MYSQIYIYKYPLDQSPLHFNIYSYISTYMINFFWQPWHNPVLM